MPDRAFEDWAEVFRDAGQLCVNFLRMSPQRAFVLGAKLVAG